MYAVKPMQAISCLNHVLRDRPAGWWWIVAVAPIKLKLKHALVNCIESGGKGNPIYDTI
jgi:hypothetical protein